MAATDCKSPRHSSPFVTTAECQLIGRGAAAAAGAGTRVAARGEKCFCSQQSAVNLGDCLDKDWWLHFGLVPDLKVSAFGVFGFGTD